jgi:hypothetical protein
MPAPQQIVQSKANNLFAVVHHLGNAGFLEPFCNLWSEELGWLAKSIGTNCGELLGVLLIKSARAIVPGNRVVLGK